MKQEKQIFEKYKKNKNKLVMTGGLFNPWFWRRSEISFKDYVNLTQLEKDAHIKYLITLSDKNRSTNDDYILKFYAPEKVSRNIHYFSIEDNKQISSMVEDEYIPTEVNTESVQVGELFLVDNEINSRDTVTEIPDEKFLISLGKNYLIEYLDAFFEYENTRWKDDLKFTTCDKFIENTKNYMVVDDLTVAHIKAYKKL
jgi:hypothetical protein